MRYSTDLLWQLAAATARGEVAAGDGLVSVPSIFSPVIEIPGSLQSNLGFDRFEPQRTSFGIDHVLQQAASSAEAGTTTCTFGRGLWQVVLHVAFMADYTRAPAGAFNGNIQLNEPGVHLTRLIFFPEVANVAFVQSLVYRWLFERDGPQLRIQEPATGVGQTNWTRFSVSASRLN